MNQLRLVMRGPWQAFEAGRPELGLACQTCGKLWEVACKRSARRLELARAFLRSHAGHEVLTVERATPAGYPRRAAPQGANPATPNPKEPNR